MKPSKRWSLFVVLLAVVVLPATTCAVHDPSLASAPPHPANTALGFPRQRNIRSGLRFDRISVAQGLSHGTVNCILQDRYGFLWLGTSYGLNKYDGHSFTVYKHNPDDPTSLSHNTVWSLFEDSAGVLWVGTYGGGLNRFDRDTGQFARYDADDFQNVTDEPKEFRNVVWAIDEHPAGVLWIATYGGGLVRFDLELEEFTSYAPDPADPDLGGHEWITALAIDQAGFMWIGTSAEGLDRFDPATGQFTTYRHNPDDPASLGHDWITAIVQDRSGYIWIGTAGRGLDRFDPKTETFSHFRHDPTDPASLAGDYVWSLSEDPAGVLWVGTANNGLDALDPATGTFVHFHHDAADLHSLSSNRIRMTYHDRSGILWAATRGAGLNWSGPASIQFTHYQGDPHDPQRPGDYPVLSLHEDEEGVLWIGTAGGLDALDRDSGEWRHYRHDPADPHSLGNNAIHAIHQDPSGVFWLGTEDGFYRFDPAMDRFERLAHRPPDPGDVQKEIIYSIDQDRAGMLWLGTHGRGLSAFNPVTGEFTYHLQSPEGRGLSNNWVRDVVEDESGILWIGTQDGLNRYDRQTGEWRWFRHNPADPHSLSHNWIRAVYQDRAGTLWVGTLGGGLDRFDRDSEAFAHYTDQDGLAGNEVIDILEGGGYLWVCTPNGLSRHDPRAGSFKTYTAGDGLPVNEFMVAYAGKNGELLAGGINGLVSFYPDQMVDNPYIPPVVLTSLQQNGVKVETGRAPEDLQEVTFRWPDNSFEFGFTALNYTLPQKNQHAYKLEGFDKNWNDIGNLRFGRYTNLPGGTYTLRLKGSNNDGVWNEEGASIKVTIVPPFWSTGWFWGMVALVLVTVAFGGYRLRIRSLQARSRALEQRVEQEIGQRMKVEEALRASEMERAVAAERSRLARELHDAVTQTLFSASLIAEALPTLWERNQELGRERLATLRKMSRGALAEMRTLLLELRPAALVETSLQDLLRQLGEAVTGREGLPVTVVVEGECHLPADLHVALYRIAQEALNNVVKHAQASQVAIRLRCTPVPEGEPAGIRVELDIRDDGRGFDPEDVPPERMGLSIMRERAGAAGAHLEIQSSAGRGTRLTVTWPGKSGECP